jgi:hypothetical protein
MNVFQLFANAFQIIRIACGITIIAHLGKNGCLFIFLVQYLSAHFFVFAKNGAKPRVASHGLAYARRIPEQFLPYFISAMQHFKIAQIIFCNAATIARYLRLLCILILSHFIKIKIKI